MSWSARGGTDGSGTGVYAQRVDASFSAIGDVILVNSTTSSDQANPSIIKLDDRDYVVGWSSEGQDGDESGIYAQVISTETRDENITNTETTVTGGIDFSTADLAKTSISTIDDQIERLMENQIQVGVGLNAIDHSLNTINQKLISTQKAASQIGDVDMASQIAKLSSYKLLQDVGLTMLSTTAGLKNQLINVVRSAML